MRTLSDHRWNVLNGGLFIVDGEVKSKSIFCIAEGDFELKDKIKELVEVRGVPLKDIRIYRFKEKDEKYTVQKLRATASYSSERSK